MATKLKEVDVVIVGLGWTGGILAKELTEAGLKVVALERGAMRTTEKDFAVPNIRDELRYVVRHDLMQNTARDTLTIRNNPSQEALPMRRLGSFLPGEGVGGSGVHWSGHTWRWTDMEFKVRSHVRGALRQELHSRRHDDPGLGHHLRRARALLRQVRIHRGGVRQGGQPQGPDPAGRQSVRGAARARVSAAAADADPRERDVRRGREEQRLSSVPAADRQRVARLHQSGRLEIRRLPVLRLSASASAARPTPRAARTSR